MYQIVDTTKFLVFHTVTRFDLFLNGHRQAKRV